VIYLKKFYVTTPIYYANDVPHIGSAYTTLAADILSRYHKLKGEKAFFLTGTDEHGKKIQQIAESNGKKPEEFVDEIVTSFKELWKRLNISNDYFIRTTDPQHVEEVKRILQELYDKGFIYKGYYEAYYCVGCEQYLTESDIVEGCCPLHKKAPEVRKEESYLFKLSGFQEKLLELIGNDSIKILPISRKNEILNFVKEGLKDVSVSRKKSEVYWGIELPFDTAHTCYVWIDAFWNYITGLKNNGVYDVFWPPEIQLMAKDIIRVHSTIWLALLLALDIELPKEIFVHGYFTVEGKKMSKTLGNVVDPNKMIHKYGVDALRYYLFRGFPFGEDGDFSEKALVSRYNSELGDLLGNLLNRVLVLLEKGCDGVIPNSKGAHDIENISLNVVKSYVNLMDSLELHNALNDVFYLVGELNKYVNTTKPWEIKDKDVLEGVLFDLIEGLRFIGVLLYPFTPETSEKIFDQLGLEKKFLLADLRWGRLTPGTRTKRGKVLFEKIKN